MAANTPVVVRGTRTGNTIDVATSGGITPVGAAPPMPAATGTKSVLVINVVWPGTSLTATTSQEQAFMFGSDTRSVASFYSDVSYGQMTWNGTETPTYTIADPGSCDLYGLAAEANSAATAGGYSTTSYTDLMINAPNLYCGAAGYGEIGGPYTWVQNGLWNLDDGYARLVPTHEIGHSLGLYHSHGLECGSTTVTSTCLSDLPSHNEEYGNAWDVMGNNWPGDAHDSVTWFSARQELLLGWLAGSRVSTVTTSGTYSLTPLEKSGVTTPQVLVISTPNHTYYVEYRQPIGQDAFMSSYSAATNSVHVNVTGSFGSDTGPFALDYTPGSDTISTYSDWFDAPLAIGRSFTDPENVFTLSPTSQNGTTATVNVTFRTQPTHTLTVTKSGAGAGTVTSSPAGISCGTTCSGAFQAGSSVTLTATSATGSSFAGWSGACSGTAATCVVALTSDQTATAAFAVTTGSKVEEPAANYDGWTRVATSSASGGSWRISATAGNSCTMAASGPAVQWVTRKGPDQGIANITIDGVSKGNVDLYSATAQAFTKSYTGLAGTSHTVVVKVTGTKNASSTGTRVVVDAFVVGATTTQDSANAIWYDTWKGSTASVASGGTYRATGTANAVAAFAFTGTGVDWITSTGAGWGRAEVYIDGADKGTVDLYAGTTTWQVAKSYRNLAAGSHTIKVKVLGSKNSLATSTKVPVDAFIKY